MVKRLLDLILASVGLVLSVVLWAIVALAIKLEDTGPVFYRQERWGRKGEKFRPIKFRTMVPDSDQKYGIKQARENDRRVTKVGRILRSTGLDELPQIINILWGEMSFVGPRPLAVGEIIHDDDGNQLEYEQIPGFRERLSVRPGLTSLSTIYRPKDIHPKDKFHYDLLYIKNYSIWLDLKLIVLSFWISFRGKWESRANKV